MILLLLAASLLLQDAEASLWAGVWTYDACHEDRKPDHEAQAYCREGRDRILIARDEAGSWDITLCPSDPWGERDVALQEGGRVLTFRTREGYRVRLSLGEDRKHFRGTFRGADGHLGRVWGHRVAGCG